MKNVALFLILAVLTVAALVAWNITSKSSTPSIATITPTPMPQSEGGALRKFLNTAGSLFENSQSVVTPTANPTGTVYPTVTIGPTPMGGYTKGGLPAVTGTPKPTTSPTPMQGTNTRGVVTLNDNGFSPKTVTITKEGTVIFVNNSSHGMWVKSKNNQLSGFDLGSSLAKGSSYEYRFSNTGSFEYFNVSKSSETGTVIVN